MTTLAFYGGPSPEFRRVEQEVQDDQFFIADPFDSFERAAIYQFVGLDHFGRREYWFVGWEASWVS